VALAVIEGDGFNALVGLEGVGQAGGGILPAGEKDEGGLVQHAPMLSPRPRLLTAGVYSGFSVFLIRLGE